MKKWVLRLSIVVFLLLCLCRCYFYSPSYRFKNSQDMIIKVELLYNQNDAPTGYSTFDFTLIKELSSSEIDLFMRDIYQLDTDRCGNPPRWGYGRYIAKITYSNGDVEMLGSYNIEFIEYGQEQTGTGIYFFLDDKFEEIFKKYAGECGSKIPLCG